MKKTTLLIFLFLLTGITCAGTWIPTGPLASNCAIFTMTGTSTGDIIIADYNSTLQKKLAGSNTWVPAGLAGRKIRYLTTAPNGDIFAISGTGAYVITSCVIFYKSTDKGETWNEVFKRDTPYSWAVGGAMLFMPDNTILASFPHQKGPTVGDIISTMICRSTNGGDSWFMTDSLVLGWPGGMLNTANNKVFLGTTEDGVYAGQQNGMHWNPIDTSPHFMGTRYTTDIVRSSQGTIYIAMSRQVKRSTDDGQSFVTLNTPSPTASIKAICAITDNEIYISTDDKKVYLSTNMGNSWQTAMTGLPASPIVSSLKYIDGKLYAGVYAAGVYYLTPDVVGVHNGNELAKAFVLKQNYPNPFNPSTKISFSIAKSSFVNLSVFDASGKKVISLINEYKNAGEYDVNFDAAELTSGVYFYQLQSEGLTETKKMFLVR